VAEEAHLPYGRQWIEDDDVVAVGDVLRSDYLTTGPTIPAFEAALAAVTGSAHAVAVNSGTSALHAMYAAAGIGPGDEIVTSPLTFAATANAALYLEATVRFADVDPRTGNLDPRGAAQATSSRTRAVVAVDYAGHPADYDALSAVAEERGTLLLADAAHSLGATYRGRRVGTLAHASELSFHPVKPITTAEGGAVTTDDAELAERASRFRTHGITRDRSRMGDDEGPWYYEMLELGYNYRLTDVQAALGMSQLRRLDAFLKRRRQIAGRYSASLADADQLELPSVDEHVEPGWHLYVIRVRDAEQRRPFFDRLRAHGLGVQVHYVPVYWHPYYRDLGYRRGQCPVAEDFYARAVSLPIFPRMSDDDVDRVIDAVRSTASELL
jgi:UDP-4-amino-4,6-dideoxy-N-acetyl-beta-L-altrosamine transaminase